MAWNPNRRLGQTVLDEEEYDPTVEDLSVAERIAAENGDPPPEQPPQMPGRGMAPASPQLPPPPPPQMQAGAGNQPAPPPNPGPPQNPVDQARAFMQANNGQSMDPGMVQNVGSLAAKQLGARATGDRPPNPGPPPGMPPPDPGLPPDPSRTTTNLQVPGQGPLPSTNPSAGPMGAGANMPPAYQLPPVPQPGAYTFSGDKPVQHPSVLRRIGGALLGYASGEGIPGMVRGAMRPGYEQAVERAGMTAGATERQAKLSKEQAEAEHLKSQSGLANQQAKTLAEEGKQRRYVGFGTGGIMDERTGEVIREPANASATDYIEIAPDKGKALGIMPRPDGKYLLPKEGVGPFLSGSMHQPQEGELPLGDKVGQFNQALTQRWQVLNPGKPLPPAYTLSPNATQKDYDRLNQSLGGAEAAEGAKSGREAAQAARDQAAAAREQAHALSVQAQADKEAKEGRAWVMGTHPQTGEIVAAPASQAQSLGLQDVADLPTPEVQKVMAARHWLRGATQTGQKPADMGILQIVDALDKTGDLGPIASRFNEFMVGKFGGGTGDPRRDQLITALRNKLNLSNTLLMNVHVGQRGGAYMLEHFSDMANAGKMNANILRTGVEAEANYVKDRAMMPPAAAKPNGGVQAPNNAPNAGGGRGGGRDAMVKVQIPGQPPGQIRASALAQFQKDHPDAKVLQ